MAGFVGRAGPAKKSWVGAPVGSSDRGHGVSAQVKARGSGSGKPVEV